MLLSGGLTCHAAGLGTLLVLVLVLVLLLLRLLPPPLAAAAALTCCCAWFSVCVCDMPTPPRHKKNELCHVRIHGTAGAGAVGQSRCYHQALPLQLHRGCVRETRRFDVAAGVGGVQGVPNK